MRREVRQRDIEKSDRGILRREVRQRDIEKSDREIDSESDRKKERHREREREKERETQRERESEIGKRTKNDRWREMEKFCNFYSIFFIEYLLPFLPLFITSLSSFRFSNRQFFIVST